MTNNEPRSIQDLLKNIQTRGLPQSRSSGFVPNFEVCVTHGKWQANFQEATGVVRWQQPGCPTCRKQAQTQALVANADISRRFMRCSFENYHVENPGQKAALETCKEYVKNFKENYQQGRCLTLRGNPGTGKNHLSAAIMLEVMKQNYTALRIKASAFLGEFWSKDFTEREPWMNKMGKVDLLVIDEIGRSSNGKAATDAFFRLIDSRYEAMRPTIVITNLSKDALKETLGHAAYDRLSEGGKIVNFAWTSDRIRECEF